MAPRQRKPDASETESQTVAATAGEGTRPEEGAPHNHDPDEECGIYCPAATPQPNGCCAKCHAMMHTRDGDEPTELCDHCAHEEVTSLRAALDAATFRAREESRRADAALARAEKAEADRDGAKAWAVRAMQDCHGIEARHIEEQKARQAAEARLEEVRGALLVLGRVVQGDSVEPKALNAAMTLWAKEDESRALAAPEPRKGGA